MPKRIEREGIRVGAAPDAAGPAGESSAAATEASAQAPDRLRRPVEASPSAEAELLALLAAMGC
jgi:hypothetical protein